jgi:alpha-1,6-mannosyltransferase
MGIAAAAFATAMFLLALREAWRGGLRLETVIRWGLAFHVLFVALPLLISNDVLSYAMYGRILSVHHANPYTSLPLTFPSDPFFPLVAPLWRGTPSVYWPGFVLLSAGVTSLVHSPAGTVLVFKLIAGAASAGSMLLVARTARRLWPARAAFAAMLVGWNPVMLLHVVGGGHNDALIALALAGAVAFLARAWQDGSTHGGTSLRLELFATGAATAAVLVKPTIAWPVLLLIVAAVARQPRERRWARLVAHLSVCVGLIVVFCAPFLRTKDPTLGLTSVGGYQNFLSPEGLLITIFTQILGTQHGQGAADAARVALRVAFPLVFTVALAALAWHQAQRAVRGTLRVADHVASWGWVLLLFLLTAPWLFPWYLAWLLPVAWALPEVPLIAAVLASSFLAVSETVANNSVSGIGLFSRVMEKFAFVPVLFVLLIWMLADLAAQLRSAETPPRR